MADKRDKDEVKKLIALAKMFKSLMPGQPSMLDVMKDKIHNYTVAYALFRSDIMTMQIDWRLICSDIRGNLKKDEKNILQKIDFLKNIRASQYEKFKGEAVSLLDSHIKVVTRLEDRVNDFGKKVVKLSNTQYEGLKEVREIKKNKVLWQMAKTEQLAEFISAGGCKKYTIKTKNRELTVIWNQLPNVESELISIGSIIDKMGPSITREWKKVNDYKRNMETLKSKVKSSKFK